MEGVGAEVGWGRVGCEVGGVGLGCGVGWVGCGCGVPHLDNVPRCEENVGRLEVAM